MVSILKRIPRVQYSILRDFNRMMLGEEEHLHTQADIAKKYGTAQSTISRILRYTTLQQLALFKIALSAGNTYEYIANNMSEIYDSDRQAMMTALYAIYHMAHDDDHYIRLACKFGLAEFMQELLGTRANKYGRIVTTKGEERAC